MKVCFRSRYHIDKSQLRIRFLILFREFRAMVMTINNYTYIDVIMQRQCFRLCRWNAREVMYVQFPGDLFLRMLKALIIPLLFSSITSAIGSLDLSLSKKIGGRAILYYLVTTIVAVFEGILLVVIIHPGRGNFDTSKGSAPQANVTTVDTLLDLVR